MGIKICIDPGHGGTDRANRGKTGYIEADGVLDISLKLRDELISTGDFDVKLTREKDMTLGIRDRGKIASSWGADMFISEHSNATGTANNTTRRSVDVYYSVDTPNDKDLAYNLAKAVSEVMGNKVGGAFTRESEVTAGEDYYGVIDSAQDGGVKHVLLIENGFHDNLQDESILKDPAKRTEIAKAQAKVICNYYNIQYPKKEDPNMWKKNIVKEALALGLINDEAWIEKYDEAATVWFVLAVAISVFKKLKGK